MREGFHFIVSFPFSDCHCSYLPKNRVSAGFGQSIAVKERFFLLLVAREREVLFARFPRASDSQLVASGSPSVAQLASLTSPTTKQPQAIQRQQS